MAATAWRFPDIHHWCTKVPRKFSIISAPFWGLFHLNVTEHTKKSIGKAGCLEYAIFQGSLCKLCHVYLWELHHVILTFDFVIFLMDKKKIELLSHWSPNVVVKLSKRAEVHAIISSFRPEQKNGAHPSLKCSEGAGVRMIICPKNCWTSWHVLVKREKRSWLQEDKGSF